MEENRKHSRVEGIGFLFVWETAGGGGRDRLPFPFVIIVTFD